MVGNINNDQKIRNNQLYLFSSSCLSIMKLILRLQAGANVFVSTSYPLHQETKQKYLTRFSNSFKKSGPLDLNEVIIDEARGNSYVTGSISYQVAFKLN